MGEANFYYFTCLKKRREYVDQTRSEYEE